MSKKKLNRSHIRTVSIERRNCGEARAITMMVEPPPDCTPSYQELVLLAGEVFQDSVGADMALFMSDANVMAWSGLENEECDRGLFEPREYRVCATFVPKNKLRSSPDDYDKGVDP